MTQRVSREQPSPQHAEAQRPFDLRVLLLSSILKEVTENHRTHIPGILPRRGNEFRNTYGVAAKVMLKTGDNESIPVVIRTAKSEPDASPDGTKTAHEFPPRPFALQRGLYLPNTNADIDANHVHIASSSQELQTFFNNHEEINPRDAAETILTALQGFGYSFSPKLLREAENIGVLPMKDGSYVILDGPEEPMTIPTKPAIQSAPRRDNTKLGTSSDVVPPVLNIRAVNLGDDTDPGLQQPSVPEVTPQELEAKQVQEALPDLIERFTQRLHSLPTQRLADGLREAKTENITLRETRYKTDRDAEKPIRNLVIEGKVDGLTVQIIISDPGSHQDRSPHIAVRTIDQHNTSSVGGIDTLATLEFANKLL